MTPAHDYGVLAESGWFVRDHQTGSEVEKVGAVKAAGFRYLALNIDALNPPEGWNDWRIVAGRAGVPVLPWGRVLTAEDVQKIRDIQLDWGSPGIALNIEDEAESTLTPEIVAELTKDW